MRFNIEKLYQYCRENNITLLKNYNNVKINRDNYIEGNCSCVNCIYTFNKTFQQLVKT